MSDSRLQLSNLSCERSGRILFSGLNVELADGQGLRVAGTNGSGKTTLLRAIAGLSKQYEGSIQWQGCETFQTDSGFLSDLLYIGHAPGIQSALTPLENLRWWQALHGAEIDSKKCTGKCTEKCTDMNEALNRVGLAEFIDTPCIQLSAGQQRRAALARLFLSHHRLWILDEPFTAIDASGVTLLENVCREHLQDGGMVILTTHQDFCIEKFLTLNIDDLSVQSSDFGSVNSSSASSDGADQVGAKTCL